MLTEPAFNALLKTLEEPPAHVVFVLATTEPRELPATILSRCQRFDFRPIPSGEIAAGLERILAEERARGQADLAVDPDALALIARAAAGSLRDALSLLDTALAYGEGRVGARTVEELIGSGGDEAAWGLAGALLARRAPEALERIDRAAAEGFDVGLLARETMEVLRRALLAAVVGQPSPDATSDEAERLRALAAAGQEALLLLVKGLLDAEAAMRESPHPRVDLEVAVVRLCHRPEPEALERLIERLERAEGQLRGYGPPPGERAAARQTDLLADPGVAPVASEAASLPGRPSTPPRRTGAPAAVSPPAERRVPGSPPAEPPAPGGAPERAPERAEVWQRIVAEVMRLRPTLAHLLADAVIVTDEAGRLSVAVPNGSAFTQDQVRDQGNRQIVLEAARRVRPDVRELVMTTGPAAAGPGGAVTSHPAVRAAVELFNGEVTAVRPAGRGQDPVSSAGGPPESGEQP
jgi:DNA polymerase-3 subunit gamma/tau